MAKNVYQSAASGRFRRALVKGSCAGHFETDAKVGVVCEWRDRFTTRFDAEFDQPRERFPADPSVGVGENVLEERSQLIAIRVDYRVNRRAPNGAARIVDETLPGGVRDRESRVTHQTRRDLTLGYLRRRQRCDDLIRIS